MISGHGEDLLTANPATVFENPGLVPDAEVPQKIKNVIRLHRGIQAFKNCLIHSFDGRKKPTAIADDVGMSQSAAGDIAKPLLLASPFEEKLSHGRVLG